jgi:hypothetical protein
LDTETHGYQYRHEFESGYPAFLESDRHRPLVVFCSIDPALASSRYLAANLLNLASEGRHA